MSNNKSLYIVAALLLAVMLGLTLSSITYSSKIYTIQIHKQHEKLLKDPEDAKIADLIGLADICQDIRFRATLSLHLNNQETFSIQRACEDIKTRIRLNQFSDHSISMRR